MKTIQCVMCGVLASRLGTLHVWKRRRGSVRPKGAHTMTAIEKVRIRATDVKGNR